MHFMINNRENFSPEIKNTPEINKQMLKVKLKRAAAESKMTEKMHNAWDLWRPGKQDMYNSLVIWPKKSTLPRLVRAPYLYMRSHHQWKTIPCKQWAGLRVEAPRHLWTIHYYHTPQSPMSLLHLTSLPHLWERTIPGNNQRLTPCHDVRKSCHHCRSNRNSELRRIG